MKRTYEVRDRADKRAIREFLKREGQFLLPMLVRCPQLRYHFLC